MKLLIKFLTLWLFLFAASGTFSLADEPVTKVVLLGTGNPNATPDRLGPATAIVVGGNVYLVDFGVGITRAVQAAKNAGLEAMSQENLTIAFLTHIHSDHTLGLSDLINTPWILGREEPLEVFGPKGVEDLVNHTLLAYQGDIKLRAEGTQPSNNTGWQAVAHEIGAGIVFRDEYVTVTAFEVCHGQIKPSFGFRFDTPDKVIVISGDTTYCRALIEAAKGADILVHEVYSEAGFETLPEDWKIYHSAHHTSASDLARIANEVRPGLLVLSHQIQWDDLPYELILEEVKKEYDGEVAFGNDGDVY
ncbi:MAG: MBL fold metallo-hydrolase [Sphingomonadales bacterium]